MENSALLGSEMDMASVGKKERLWERSSDLHRRALIFLSLLILLASVLSIVAIYHHSRGETILDNFAAFNEKGGVANPTLLNDQAEARSHVDLESGLTILTIILFSVLVLFMVFFVRNIINPLAKLEKLTREMADGRLDRLVCESEKVSCCSIGTIGENVNSLAMNLQEVLLLVWNMSEHNLKTVEETIGTLEKPEGISREQVMERLELIKMELEQMQELTGQFEFFDVTLRDHMAIAKDDSTQIQRPY